MTILTIDNWEVTSLDFVGKTNTLAIDISGVNVNATVDGGVTCLWLIPVTVEAMYISNITIHIELATESPNEVNW